MEPRQCKDKVPLLLKCPAPPKKKTKQPHIYIYTHRCFPKMKEGLE